MMTSLRRSIFALAALTMSSIGFGQKVSLSSLQKVYSNTLQKIEFQYATSVKPLKKTYYQDLMKFNNYAKKAGDIEALVEIKEEEKRFLAENNLPEKTPDGANATIEKIQQQYRQSAQTLNLVRNKQVFNLTGQFINRLERLKNAYALKEDLKRGLIAKKELDRLKAHYQTLQSISQAQSPGKPNAGHTQTRLSPHETALLHRGLILHYKFDTIRNGEVNDSGTSRNHGRVKNVEWIKEGLRGGALHFKDPESQLLSNRKFALRGNQPRTISIWVFPEKKFERGTLFGWGKYERNGLNNLYLIHGKTLYFHGGPGQDHVFQTGPIEPNTWHHVAFVYDGPTTRIYLNGQASELKHHKLKTKDSPLSLGFTKHLYQKNGFGGSFLGKMDEFMAWKRALSEKEIEQLYKVQGGHLPEKAR